MISWQIWVALGVLLPGVFIQLMQFGLWEGFKPPELQKTQVMETIVLRVHFLLRFKSARRHGRDFRTLGKMWFSIKTF